MFLTSCRLLPTRYMNLLDHDGLTEVPPSVKANSIMIPTKLD